MGVATSCNDVIRCCPDPSGAKAIPCSSSSTCPNEPLPPCVCNLAALPSCLLFSHVEHLVAGLPDEVLIQLGSPSFWNKCIETFNSVDHNSSGHLEGEELAQAVHSALPAQLLSHRLQLSDISSLLLAFDEDLDGRISRDEFIMFCKWVTAMEYHGFFSGTAPLSQIATARSADEGGPAQHLLLVSDYLDPKRVLKTCVLSSVRCVYYHPDGITTDEFSAQLESAAYIRANKQLLFRSVGLANHGPDEDGFWHICADYPVHLTSKEEAWPGLMPLFRALAAMVDSSRAGHVDLLACQFAATPGGLECIKMIEKEVQCRFSASTDQTGNVSCGGNWELEVGGRNVAPIYFDEGKLEAFQGLMACRAGKGKRRHYSTNELVYGAVIKDCKDEEKVYTDTIKEVAKVAKAVPDVFVQTITGYAGFPQCEDDKPSQQRHYQVQPKDDPSKLKQRRRQLARLVPPNGQRTPQKACRFRNNIDCNGPSVFGGSKQALLNPKVQVQARRRRGYD